MIADAIAERPDDRHGAAAARAGSATTNACRRSTRSAAAASSRTWSGCGTAATTSCCAGSSGSASPKRVNQRFTGARVVAPLPERASQRRTPGSSSARGRLETRLAPRLGGHRLAKGRTSDRTMPARCRMRITVNALAHYLELAAREAGAAGEHRPCAPCRVARRAARDEDHDGPHAGPVERRELTASGRQPLSALRGALLATKDTKGTKNTKKIFSNLATPLQPASYFLVKK